MTRHSQFSPGAPGLNSQFRPAFSLLELMIAIVVLGIGLVMVATVFPIGLDIARQSVQINIAAAIGESALATLRLRVPGENDLYTFNSPPDPPVIAPAHVLVPDVAGTDLDTIIDDKDAEALTVTIPARLFPASPPVKWGPTWADVEFDPAPAQGFAQFFTRARSFTEKTGWDIELLNGVQGLNNTAVVPSQNLPVNYASILAALPPTPPPTLNDLYEHLPVVTHPSFIPRAHLPRVSLLDQVYPPVSPLNSDGSDRAPADVLAELASRRYSWTAIHHRMSSDASASVRYLFVIVVPLHRADLNGRYARQGGEDSRSNPPPPNNAYDVDFPDFNTDCPDGDRCYLREPWPDPDPATDKLFPRPWLVMLDEINAGTGEVRCTPHVARLLPPDSVFVIAQTKGPYSAGNWPRVLSRTYNPTSVDPDDIAILQIARGGGGGAGNVPVWVFPPAIQDRGIRDSRAPRFDAHSPVVGDRIQMGPVPIK